MLARRLGRILSDQNRAASLTVADNTSGKSVYQYNNIKIVLVISTGHLELYHAARGCS